jgi:hypothetical protein
MDPVAPSVSDSFAAGRIPAGVGGRLEGVSARLGGAGLAPWLLAFGLVFALGADSGGYWPRAWGWSALAAFWIAAIALVVRADIRLTRLEFLFPIGLLAFACWSMVSSLWASSATQPAQSTELALVYVGGAGAALLVTRRSSYRGLLAGTWAGLALIGGYALLTRCFPERLGSIDDLAGYRLQQPLGYWNALGIFAAIGLLLALGLAAHGRTPLLRTLAGASTVVLASTLYFTFSRGAWVALGLGLLMAVAVDRQRLRLICAAITVGVWPALAVLVASRSSALTHQHPELAAASHAGHRFAWIALAFAVGAGASAVVFGVAAGRITVPRRVRLAFVSALVLLVVAALTTVSVVYGSPPTIARRAYDGFVAPPKVISGDLNRRLFVLSGGQRVPQWKVAWKEYRLHPWLGGGAGSYKRYWDQYRPVDGNVLNAHSLYVETLAETGPVGLALLLAGLLAPLAALVRRRRALSGVAAGVYLAFLAHAGVDWDWQMPAVTLAALFCGAAVLASTRGDDPSSAAVPRALRIGGIALAIALAAFAFVSLRGNSAVTASEDAAAQGEFAKSAAKAHTATAWAPWSSRAWQLRGEGQYGQNDVVAARASFRRAVAKDREDWSIWLDLARVTRGAERRHALAHAAELNPLNSEIRSLRGKP